MTVPLLLGPNYGMLLDEASCCGLWKRGVPSCSATVNVALRAMVVHRHLRRASRRPFARILGSIVILIVWALACFVSSSRALAGRATDGPSEGKPPAATVRRRADWVQPHRLRLRAGVLDLEGVVQDVDTWQGVLSDGTVGHFLSASKSGDGSLAYVVEYDSAVKGGVKLPLPKGLDRMAFSAASKDNGQLNDSDWTLQIGSKHSRMSVTSDEGALLYDGSLGQEILLSQDLKARYGVDVKRRANATGRFRPNWMRQSLGLLYTRPGDREAKVFVGQANPDEATGRDLDIEASISGVIESIPLPEAPKFVLRVTKDAGKSVIREGSIRIGGIHGFSGGLDVAVQEGKATVSGTGQLELMRQLVPGVDITADTRLVAKPTGTEGKSAFDLEPVGVRATANVAKLVPSVAEGGSQVELFARYKPGMRSPTLGATASLIGKPVGPVELALNASLDSDGNVAGQVRAVGAVSGVRLLYEASAKNGTSPVQFGEVLYPAKMWNNRARMYGRFTQSPEDFEGKPRLQVGLQYDSMLAGWGKISGEGPVFDNGRGPAGSLLEARGARWNNPRPKKVRNNVAALRSRIASSEGAARRWVLS